MNNLKQLSVNALILQVINIKNLIVCYSSYKLD